MCPDDVWQTVTLSYVHAYVRTYITCLKICLSAASPSTVPLTLQMQLRTYVHMYTASSFLCSLQLFLEAPDDIQCFKFNPYKPNFVVGGCLNGLVSVYCVAMVLLYCYCVVSFDIILTVRTHVCHSTWTISLGLPHCHYCAAEHKPCVLM